MNGENQLTFALWMMTLHLIAGAGKFRAQLEPKVVVKHVSESLELVCTALDCPSEAKFTWKTLGDITIGGAMKSNQMTSRKTYSHLTIDDEKTVVCHVDCGGIKEQRKTKIQVYSFPSDPVISRKNDLTLVCTVRSVYSSEMFELRWLHGDTVLPGGESTFYFSNGVQDVSSEYTLSEEYLGKNITCRGTLSLSGIPEGQNVRSVTAQYGPAFITTSGNTTVKVGEHLELRCDADGKSNILWRKLGKSEVTLLSRDKVAVIENVTRSDAGVYECEASTELASRRSTVGVTVQGPPNVPTLRHSHAGNPRAGDYVTITCDADSDPPVQLTISGASLNQVEKQSSSVSINIPSIQLKHSGLYFCEAKNEFGSMRSSINITVQASPRNSTVLVYPSAEVMEAQNITVHCSTVSFPPATIILTREADGFEFRSPNGTFHLFNLKSEDKGTYRVNFTNELGYEVQTFELIVKEQQTVTPILTKTLVPAVGSVSLLTVAALLLRYLRRTKKNSSDFNLGEALDM